MQFLTRMPPDRRCQRAAGAAALLAAVLAGTVSSTHAMVIHDSELGDGVIHADMGGPTVHLAWDGSQYHTVEATFVGERTISPGDWISKTLEVTNAGPSDAIAQISVRAAQPATGPANPDLASAVTAFWGVPGHEDASTFAALLKQSSPPAIEIPLAHGATMPITAGVTMPAQERGHTNAGRASTVLTFDVVVNLRGAGQPPARPGEEPPPKPVRTPLAVTGAAITAVAATAIALIVTGTLLSRLGARRRHPDTHGNTP